MITSIHIDLSGTTALPEAGRDSDGVVAVTITSDSQQMTVRLSENDAAELWHRLGVELAQERQR